MLRRLVRPAGVAGKTKNCGCDPWTTGGGSWGSLRSSGVVVSDECDASRGDRVRVLLTADSTQQRMKRPQAASIMMRIGLVIVGAAVLLSASGWVKTAGAIVLALGLLWLTAEQIVD